MAEKKTMIVIKKITVSGGGHHGGAWKVAFADFMTAMMAFFLCMWLISQNDETRKALEDYFTTPSVIEYEFQNFGVVLTLEKLFNDILNEPLSAVSKLFQPMDKTPDVFEFNNENIGLSWLEEQLGSDAKNLEIQRNEISFLIPDYKLFRPGTAEPNADFLPVMENVKKVTEGLQDSVVEVTSQLFSDGVADGEDANHVANARLDLVRSKIEASREYETTKVTGSSEIKERKPELRNANITGFMKFVIKKGANPSNSKKLEGSAQSGFDSEPRKIDLYDELNEDFKNEIRKTQK